MPGQGDENRTTRSLTTTLAGAFALISITALVISGSFEIYLLLETEQDAITSKQHVVAHQARNEVAEFIQKKLSVMETAVRLTRSTNAWQGSLEDLLGLQPAFRQVLVLNAQNKTLFRVSRVSEAESRRLEGHLGRDLFSHVKDGKRYIGPVYVDPVTSEPLVIMAVPRTNILGDVLGALVAEVNLKFMWDLVDRLKVGDTGCAYVVDGKGQLIAFGDTGRVLQGEKLDDLTDVSEFMRNPVGEDAKGPHISTGINGNLVVGTYVPLGTPDWAVMTELPVEEAYRRVLRSAVLSAITLLGMALLAGLIGVWLARRLTLPIQNLTDTATRIAGGEIHLKAVMEGPTEVARLASAFNDMTQRLRAMLDTEELRARELALEVEQRKRTEGALKESGSVLKATLESTQDGVLVVSADGKVSHCNRRFSEIWSIPDELLAKGEDDVLVDYVMPQLVDPEQFSTKVKELYQSSRPSEDTLHFRDGRIIERFSYPLGRDGEESGRAWFFRDMTDHRRTVEELRQLRNYLSNIINSMPSVLVGVDTEGRVTQWNKQAEAATGLPFDRARSRPLREVFSRLVDQMDHIKTAIRDRRVIRNTKIARDEERETRFEDVTIFPLVTNGVEGAVIRVDDVTEQVRIEEMMIQSEKMLSVGGLAAGMAHEINNPLAGMIQTASVMEDRLTNLAVPANRRAAEAAGTSMETIANFMEARGIPRMIENIHTSSRRVAEIVQNMLSFARKSEATISSHRLEELVDKTLELAATDYDLKKQYDFRRVEVVKEFTDDLPPVPCEGAKIQQVLLNILRNGAQAMQGAGSDSPRFVVRTRLAPDRRMAIIEIQDNGPGMEEAVRKRVFEPFFTTKPVGEGTGLGLSVSYFIVTENHRGEMAVESRPGAGATFIIRLPLERKSVA